MQTPTSVGHRRGWGPEIGAAALWRERSRSYNGDRSSKIIVFLVPKQQKKRSAIELDGFEAQILQQLWPLNLRPAGSLHGTIKAAGEIHIVERAYADR